MNRNNRTELNIGNSKGNIFYNVNVSNRHLLDNYFIAFDEGTYDSKDKNTIVVSPDYFYGGMLDFAKEIKNKLNENDINDGAYDTENIRYEYIRQNDLNPSFESDRAGTNVHSYPIGNERTAITLNKEEHISTKLILRGMYADKQHSSYKIAKKEWLANSDNSNIRKIIIDTLYLGWKVNEFERSSHE